MMTIKILSLYSDIMNLYGNSGNVRCMARHFESTGNTAEICEKSIGDVINFSDVDMVLMGAGTERSQKRVLRDFLQYKAGFCEYIENGGVCLFCGNSFDMLAGRITVADGSAFGALGLFDFESVEREKRDVADVVCTCEMFDEKIIGFMNKQTDITGVKMPLFNVLSGPANASGTSGEGLKYKNLFATHLSGPILVRNPRFREYVENLVYLKKSSNTDAINLEYEQQAYEESLKNLGY